MNVVSAIFGSVRGDDVAAERQICSEWSSILADSVDDNGEATTAAAPTTAVPTAAPMHPEIEDAVVIRNLFSSHECKRLVDEMQAEGFGKTAYNQAYRGNLRLLSTDEGLAAALWARLRPYVPSELTFEGAVWHAVGLNEMFRLAKYRPGDRFAVHADADFVREAGETSAPQRSMLTVNVYLNANFEGGCTRFYREDMVRWGEKNPSQAKDTLLYSFVPETGAACVFRQTPAMKLMHDGEEVRSGYKYLLRTDVMYELDLRRDWNTEEAAKARRDEEFREMMAAELGMKGL